MENEIGIYDHVVDKLLERQQLVKSELRKRFKKTKPFRTEPISNDEMLVYYDQLCNDVNAPLLMQTLVQRHGEQTVNMWIQEMEESKLRRGMK